MTHQPCTQGEKSSSGTKSEILSENKKVPMTLHQTSQKTVFPQSQVTKQPQLTDLCEYYQTAPGAARRSILTQENLPH